MSALLCWRLLILIFETQQTSDMQLNCSQTVIKWSMSKIQFLPYLIKRNWQRMTTFSQIKPVTNTWTWSYSSKLISILILSKTFSTSIRVSSGNSFSSSRKHTLKNRNKQLSNWQSSLKVQILRSMLRWKVFLKLIQLSNQYVKIFKVFQSCWSDLVAAFIRHQRSHSLLWDLCVAYQFRSDQTL